MTESLNHKVTPSGITDPSSSLATSNCMNNYYLVLNADEKIATLISFLNDIRYEKCIVYFSNWANAEYFSIVCEKLLVPARKLFSVPKSKKFSKKYLLSSFIQADSGILFCTDVMLNGIGIPKVDRVVQFDPPTKTQTFVNRCENSRSALIYLHPNEVEYVEFIKQNKNIILKKHPTELPDKTSHLDDMRSMQLQDREIMDKANKGFVTHIKYYSRHRKHESPHILSLKNLNIGLVAKCFGLLKMPTMREFDSYTDFEPCNLDINTIAYVNPEKENLRQSHLNEVQETGKSSGKMIGVPDYKLNANKKKRNDINKFTKFKKETNKQRKNRYRRKAKENYLAGKFS